MKTIKAEILMIEGAPFPAIEKVYDPSSKKCNGRITPQAPIVITGHHLDMLTWDSANLYLVSSVNDRMLIECGDIHKYSANAITRIGIHHGERRPIRIDIEMTGDVGFFQIEEVLLTKIDSSPAKGYVELYAGVAGEQPKCYL